MFYFVSMWRSRCRLGLIAPWDIYALLYRKKTLSYIDWENKEKKRFAFTSCSPAVKWECEERAVSFNSECRSARAGKTNKDDGSIGQLHATKMKNGIQ